MVTGVPYRTPACDKHLDRNEDIECPWCRLEQPIDDKEIQNVLDDCADLGASQGYELIKKLARQESYWRGIVISYQKQFKEQQAEIEQMKLSNIQRDEYITELEQQRDQLRGG